MSIESHGQENVGEEFQKKLEQDLAQIEHEVAQENDEGSQEETGDMDEAVDGIRGEVEAHRADQADFDKGLRGE